MKRTVLSGLTKPERRPADDVDRPSGHAAGFRACGKTMRQGQIRRQAIGRARVQIAPYSPRLEEDVDGGVLGCESHIPGGLLDHVRQAFLLSCGAGKSHGMCVKVRQQGRAGRTVRVACAGEWTRGGVRWGGFKGRPHLSLDSSFRTGSVLLVGRRHSTCRQRAQCSPVPHRW